jgi:hypothetical protein
MAANVAAMTIVTRRQDETSGMRGSFLSDFSDRLLLLIGASRLHRESLDAPFVRSSPNRLAPRRPNVQAVAPAARGPSRRLSRALTLQIGPIP